MNALLKDVAEKSTTRSPRVAVLALRKLPDRCATNVGELAERIGADKLDLLQWVRADMEFARLIALKLAT